MTNDGGPNPVGVAGVTVTVIGIIGYSGVTPNYGFRDDDLGRQRLFRHPADPDHAAARTDGRLLDSR